MTGVSKPKLAVWKLASCDGCQLTLLDCEDELLAVAGAVEIAHFTEASSAEIEGPYDVSLVEGSVTTERDARRIVEIRATSKILVCIGACATAGGIQALRNFADVAEFTSVVYARPDYIATLATSTPVARPRHGRLRAARLPDRQAPAARAAHRAAGGPQAPDPIAQRLLRLQAARHLVRHGGPRHPVPRAGHPGRLRRHLPGLRPRLLRLLRPGGRP